MMLERAAQEEKEMRKKLTEDMKRGWDDQRTMKVQKQANDKQDYIDSAGDALKFSGEDDNSAPRKLEQQAQVRRWTQQAMDEKAYLRQKEKDEDKAYADMIRAIEEIRDANANQEFDMRKDLNEQVKAENRRVNLFIFVKLISFIVSRRKSSC